MFLKKLLIFLLFAASLYAHKVAGVNMDVERQGNNQIKVKAYFQKSKKPLSGNEVRLISMIDNRILKKGKLKRDGLILDIPTESYWVYVIVRDNDIVKDGLAPEGGFKKAVEIKKIAFLYTALATVGFIILGCGIGYYRNKQFRQSLL